MSQGSFEREQGSTGCKQHQQGGRNVACVKNCGFFGNEATLNMCPNCYRSHIASHVETSSKPQSQVTAAVASPVQSMSDPDRLGATSSDDGCCLSMHASAAGVSLDSSDAPHLVPAQDHESDAAAAPTRPTSESTKLKISELYPRTQSTDEPVWAERPLSSSPPSRAVAEAPAKVQASALESPASSANAFPASPLSSSTAKPAPLTAPPSKPLLLGPSAAAAAASAAATPASPVARTASPRPSGHQPSRCDTCRKRVGLTGFQCRCKGLFCAVHRYSDKHSCTFDYKKAAREAIAKANPVVIKDKVIRF